MKPIPNLRQNKERYFLAFGLAFIMTLLLFLPFVIYDGGLFLYYGDYNVQQIPFYMHAHELIHNGEIFWDFGTDLGANFIGSYSFYLLGSPFFWLTMPFPTSVLPYLMAPLFALKFGVASVTAYAYIRRFTASTNAAVMGGLLYAFSGWSAYNIFFNHFHDVMAFFPLLLIAVEETVVNNRRGVLALTCALMATINYFFFAGQAVFVVIYFILRCFSKDFPITFKKFLVIAFEAVLGVALSAFMLLPSVLAVMDNPRVERYLTGWDMLLYPNLQRYGLIIQSFFFPPDIPARPNFFPDSNAKWSSVAGYLPLFSMAGVIAFMKVRRGHWAKRLVVVCTVMALVPALNSLFYMYNSSYYARWYYMPILIMAMMTAIAFEREAEPRKDWDAGAFKSGIKWCAAIVAAFTVIGILPSYVERAVNSPSSGSELSGSVSSSLSEQTTSVLSFGTLPADPLKFWVNVLIAVGCLLALIYLLLGKRDRHFWRRGMVLLCVCVYISTVSMMLFGRIIGPQTNRVTDMALEATDWELDDPDESGWYRVDVYKGIDNNAMFWGMPTINTFHSVVPVSIMTFYDSIGVQRDVGSRAEISYYGLRGLTSVKYLMFPTYSTEEEPDLAGFAYIGTQHDYKIYENEYFIPMGFTYEYYIDEERWGKTVKNYRDRILLKGVYLTGEQIERYGDILEPIEQTQTSDTTKATYLLDCQARAAQTADTFTPVKNGFISTTSFDNPELLVFSIPYEKGWSATVNGEAALVENVSHGFVAVKVPAGDCTVEFTFFPPGLTRGVYISAGAFALLALYLLGWFALRRLYPQKFTVRRYAHLREHEALAEIQAHGAYALQVARKIEQYPDKDSLSAWNAVRSNVEVSWPDGEAPPQAPPEPAQAAPPEPVKQEEAKQRLPRSYSELTSEAQELLRSIRSLEKVEREDTDNKDEDQ